MQKIIIIILCCLTTNLTFAQEMKARVVDDNDFPVGGADVTIKNIATDIILWEGISDYDGNFAVPPLNLSDDISIVVFSYGYDLFTSKVSALKTDSLVRVVMTKSVITIDEVTVVGRATPIRHEKGDLIVDLSRIKNAARLNTSDAMKRISGVLVIDGKVFIGSTEATLFINGSKSPLPEEEIMNYLEALPADAVESVRLITMPSNRYGDAQAVVDIKLKTLAPDDIYSKTTASGSLLGGDLFGYDLEEFFMMRKNNITFNTSLSYGKSNTLSNVFNSDFIAPTDETILSNSNYNAAYKAIRSISNLSLGLKNNSILDFNIFIYDDNSNNLRQWDYQNNNASIEQFKRDGKGSDNMYSGAIKYSTDTKKDNSFIFYYSGMYGNINEDYNYFEYSDNLGYQEYSQNSSRFKGHTHNFTFDGISKFNNEKIELSYGVHASLGFLNDRTTYYEPNNDFYDFNASEYEFLGYLRASYNFSEDHGITADFGYNYYMYKHHDNQAPQGVSQNYGTPLPKINYWYKTRNYILNAMFTTEIIRPIYTNLAAGKQYINNYTYTVGNPNLKNTIKYDFRINQNFWRFLDFNLYSQYRKDGMDLLRTVDENDEINVMSVNYGDKLYTETSLNIPYTLANGKIYGSFYFVLFGDIYLNINSALGLDNLDTRHKWAGSARVNLFYDITDRLSLEGLFRWRSKRILFEYTIEDVYQATLGLSYALLKEKELVLRFYASGFLGDKFHSSNTTNFYNDSRFYRETLGSSLFKLSVSYKFNKGKEIKYRDGTGNFDRIKPQ